MSNFRRMTGADSPVARTLPDDAVRAILALKDSGRTQREIGQQFGVTYTTISRIWRGARRPRQ